ncbi:hypothetical protein T281_14895 [Rhodomicrobium udaipurense JA643]|nr:hypothetical protein T281_14895 [Rhodomicrobium udaipurense JA643]
MGSAFQVRTQAQFANLAVLLTTVPAASIWCVAFLFQGVQSLKRLMVKLGSEISLRQATDPMNDH